MNCALILAVGFLFLKTGEKFATQESAGPTVALFTSQLGEFEPHIFNDPDKALAYCVAGKPAAGIVTPGFYFANATALGMEPVLEIRRQKIAAERYVLVTKGAALETLTGQTIATPLAAEPEFVRLVILQNKLGAVKLKATLDVEGAVYDLVEGAKAAAAAVLMEEGTWQAIKADAELGPQLKAVFMSEELPGNLVVKFASKLEAGQLKAALQAVPAELLDSIRVEKFVAIHQDRLKRAGELFHGQ